MAIITPALITALFTGFKSEFQRVFGETPSNWDKVATLMPSTSKSNTYGWLGQFPALVEWVGERVLKDMAAHGYSITNKLFESTVSVKRTDNLPGLIVERDDQDPNRLNAKIPADVVILEG